MTLMWLREQLISGLQIGPNKVMFFYTTICISSLKCRNYCRYYGLLGGGLSYYVIHGNTTQFLKDIVLTLSNYLPFTMPSTILLEHRKQ